MRVVVCAANRYQNRIVLGARHFDRVMHAHIDLLPSIAMPDYASQWEQGFIDQHGIFMNRTEAWKVAEAAGQIRRRVGGDTADGGTLFSENLY